MERRISSLIVGALAIIFLPACKNDDSHKDEENQFPAQSVETAFWAKYPAASSVEWEWAGVFQKAGFVLNSVDYEAWYNVSGVWLQTEYPAVYTNLPSAVKDYLANSINYPPTMWTPQQSVEVLERNGYPLWYEVELKNGNREVTVGLDEEAYEHYEAAEDFDGKEVPQRIRNFLALNYKNGWVTEGMKLENGSYVINLLYGNEVRQVNFDPSFGWVNTEWPVSPGDLPAAVQAALKKEAYAGYTIKSAKYQQYPEKEYYRIILQNTGLPGNPIMKVNLNAGGVPVL